MADDIKLAALLSEERIIFPESKKKADILNLLIDKLQDQPGLKNREELSGAIFRREGLMSTGIGINIAIPHCRLDDVKQLTAAMAVCPSGIDDYVSLDGLPVKIVIMILAGRHQQNEYIQTLSFLASRLKSPGKREKLINADNPAEALGVLEEESKS